MSDVLNNPSNVTELEIIGTKMIIPKIFYDERGFFKEVYNKNTFLSYGIDDTFIQDNMSCSSKGTIRGMHWQAYPYTQSKLVYVTRGSVLDILLDVRLSSETFGMCRAYTLSATKGEQLYVPAGIAHGFIALEDDTLFNYKVDNVYNKNSERGVNINDDIVVESYKHLNFTDLIISDKDSKLPLFKDAEYFIKG